MRSNHSLAALLCGLATAMGFTAAILSASSLVVANETAPTETRAPQCACPASAPVDDILEAAHIIPRPTLGEGERIAALEALQLALSEVGDGATYIWHARSGRISGVVSPTQSFQDRTGKVCRHIVVQLTAGPLTRNTEGVACRLATGVWQLEG